jgi:mannose/fructose/N-acetylgalactosamine-specific phosphotransferase system component IID
VGGVIVASIHTGAPEIIDLFIIGILIPSIISFTTIRAILSHNSGPRKLITLWATLHGVIITLWATLYRGIIISLWATLH